MKDNQEKKQKEIEKLINSELNSLKKLKNSEKEEKILDSEKMIAHYISMTNEIESRRTKIYEFSLTILAISLAAIGLLFSQKAQIGNYIFWPIIIGLIIQILFSITIAYIYNKQTNFMYCFRRIEGYGNTWKWFYYGNSEVLKIDTNPIIQIKKFEKTIEPYLKGLRNFLSNYKNEKINKKLENNLQQLFLLMTHNYYKNRFCRQLINIRNYGFVSSIIITFAVFIILLTNEYICFSSFLKGL